MRVLLRVWPNRHRADVVALEKVIESDDIDVMINDGDPLYIADLGREVSVEKRPDEAPEGFDLELRFLVMPSEIVGLSSKGAGWKPIAGACPSCRSH